MSKLRTFINILIAIILTPILLAALALFIINVVDWDKHRGFVKSMVERFSDFEVDEIEGIRVKLWTSAEAGVSKIKIRQTNPYSSFQSYESLMTYAKIKVFPLIFDDSLIVQSFILDHVRIKLATAAADPKAKDEADEKPFTLASLPGIFIDSATITDSSFTSYGTDKKAAPFHLQIDHAGVIAPSPDQPAKLIGAGNMSKLPFEVVGAFGSFDAFRDKNAAYPARLEAKIADHSIEARGNIRLAEGLSHFDVDASGPGLTKLKQALRLNIGDIPAYTLSFAVDKKPDVIRFDEIKAVVGESSASGHIALNFAGMRPLIQADLRSPLIRARDLKGLLKTDKSIGDPEDVPKPAGQYFSDKPIDATALRKVDTDISIDVTHFDGDKAGNAIDGANARVRLNAGKLVADPLRFSVAQGTIGGNLLFDARKSDIQVKIELGARRVNLDALLGPLATEIPVLKLKPTDMAKGMLTGHMSLAMHGKTPMAMAKTVNGPLQLAVENGKLSATIIELAGIDASQAVGDFFLKHPMKDLQCGLLSFEAKNGVYETRAFLLATSDTNFIGDGNLDLPGNKADFHLNARPRDFSLGSLRSPIYIRGPLNEIKAGLEPKPLILKGVAAVALGFINPALALLPLIETAPGKKGECRKYGDELAQVQERAKQDVSPKDLESTQKPQSKSVNR